MVNKSKKMEVNEMIKPNIISGLDLMFSSSFWVFSEDTELLCLFERRLGKSLFTIKLRFKLINLKITN